MGYKVAILMGSPNDRDKMQPAADILEREGVVSRGDRVVMVAGVPPTVQASTNLVKVHVIGETSGGLGS